MSPSTGTVFVDVRVRNIEAIRAFQKGCAALVRAADDYPWSEEIKEAIEHFGIAAAGLISEIEQHRGRWTGDV